MINQNKKAPLQDLINTTGHQNQNNNNATACEKQVANDNLHDFNENYFNAENKTPNFINALNSFFENSRTIRNKDIATDLKGVDYISSLYKVRFTIDQKNRELKTFKKWKNPNIPEITIELFNYFKNEKKKGWTIDENKVNDLIAYTFDDKPDLIFLVARIPLFLTLCKVKEYQDKNTYKRFTAYSQDKKTGNKWKSENIFENIPLYLVNELNSRFIPNIPVDILREFIIKLLGEYMDLTGHDLFIELKQGA